MTSRNAPSSSSSEHGFNVRRDLLAFIQYVQDRGLKRTYRENEIPKSDRKRLVKELRTPGVLREIESECGHWMEWISDLALRLGLVDYDTEGKYVGYSSQSPSYVDNHITVKPAALTAYMNLSSSDKERRILSVLTEREENEFHYPSLLGTQARFGLRGSAVGAAARMPLPKVRMRLLEMLSTYTPGESIPFADFVSRVQREEPNLIVDHTRARDKEARKKEPPYLKNSPLDSVYHCLYEFATKEKSGQRLRDRDTRKEISESEPDAFMRAEGRYLAYFLEEIPVLMHFVHIQYDECVPSVEPPLPSFIRSFSVTHKLAGLLGNDRAPLDVSTVTVTPDFKVFVEAPLYPDTILRALAPYTIVKSEHPHTTTLELSRAKSVETLTANPSAPPPIAVLRKLAEELPQNVAADIEEWSSHADKFLVFEDVGLLELQGVDDKQAANIVHQIQSEVSRSISKTFHMLRHADRAHKTLESAELIPRREEHPANHLRDTLLKGRSAKSPSRRKGAKSRDSLKKVSLVESGLLGLTCSDLDFLRALTKHLREQGIAPLLVDEAASVLAAPEEARKKVNSFIKKKRAQFDIQIT